jgi:hypothetical protein
LVSLWASPTAEAHTTRLKESSKISNKNKKNKKRKGIIMISKLLKRPAAVCIAVVAMCSFNGANAITNGEPDAGRHPSVCAVVVWVDDGLPGVCSGVLIAPNVVLTAGHVTAGAIAVGVVFSEDPIATGWEPRRYGYGMTHPAYAEGAGAGPGHLQELTHDVGLVILDEPMELDQYPELPALGLVDTLPMKTPVEQVGYGIQREKVQGQPPQWVVPYTRYCAQSLFLQTENVSSDEFLRITANPAQGKGGIAYGDSGGPAFLGGTSTILGVTSDVSSHECTGVTYSCRIDTPDILNWIKDILALAENNP